MRDGEVITFYLQARVMSDDDITQQLVDPDFITKYGNGNLIFCYLQLVIDCIYSRRLDCRI
jgi:hypothetical protein